MLELYFRSLDLGPTYPPIRWVLGTVSLEIKRQGREAGHSPPSSAEVKSGETIPPFTRNCSWRSA
jgi:hypothetical protein